LRQQNGYYPSCQNSRAPWEIFGTEPFLRRNACAGFFAANTLVLMRLYHLFCQYITFFSLCQGIGDILSVLGAYFLNGNKKRRKISFL